MHGLCCPPDSEGMSVINIVVQNCCSEDLFEKTTERRAVEWYSKRIYEKGPRFFAAKVQVLCEGQDRASGSRALGVRLDNNGRCCLMQILLESGSEIKTCIFKDMWIG